MTYRHVALELLDQLREPPVPSLERGPDLRALSGSCIGYRAWRIHNWQLIGTGVSEPWVPGVNEAKCSVQNVYSYVGATHRSPDPDCDCGLYALARFDKRTEWWRNADVLGAVEAWADEDETNHDRFFVHSTGFRAQYAKVILLATSDDFPRAKNAAIRALAAEHGADVCRAEHLEDAAKEHGQLVPDEWLAWAREGEPEDDGAWLSTNVKTSAGWMSVPSYLTPQYYSWGPIVSAPASPVPKPKRAKGIKRTLGYPGPPSDPTQKARKGDRVRDSKGVIWCCEKGGKPGLWEREADS